jgi:4-methyl-5(b-hydroxyethyl)-thiazole monophosphate biosynthesis
MNYLFLADGFEEIEALTVIDLLRRAEIPVQSVSIKSDKLVIGAHKIQVVSDLLIDEVNYEDLSGIILPGGMPGTTNLSKCKVLNEWLLKAHEEEKFIGAICAAPSILGDLGILEGRKAVCYPGFESKLKGATIADDAAVRDGHIITSKAAGTAVDFSLKLIKHMKSKEDSINIKRAILY